MTKPRKPRKPSPATIQRMLTVVREFYPEVKRVVDATEDLPVEVTPRDAASKAVRNHKECALAAACRRITQNKAIISRSRAYLIDGDVAVRYEIGSAVTRELTSFDRGAGFATGTYLLRKPTEAHVLGAPHAHRDDGGQHTGTRPAPQPIQGVRVAINTKRDA